jgi:hypothetical protein
MRFAYQNRGSGMVRWDGRTAPSQSRGADARSLGAYYPTTRTSAAVRRYGVRNWMDWNPTEGGMAIDYENHRPLAGTSDIPRPGSPEVVGEYGVAAPGAALVDLGGYITTGPTTVGASSDEDTGKNFTRVLAASLSGYHGVRRNGGSVFWGAVWFAAGYTMPILTPVVSLAQGFGKSK